MSDTQTKTQATEKKFEEKIGAIWERTASNGSNYFSIQVKIGGEVKNLVAFKNNNRQKDTHPHYEIYFSRNQSSVSKVQPVPRKAAPTVSNDDGDDDPLV